MKLNYSKLCRTCLPALTLLATQFLQPAPATAQSFEVAEATIAEIQAAFRSGTLTCRQLVQSYLDRIDAYDKKGPSLNAIVVVNSDALATADSLDLRLRANGPVGSLHCVPVIVKDNFETTGLPTTAGSLSLAGFTSNRDAFMVRRIREAGGIVLAKSNMAEFAFSPLETISSVLGETRNPYDTSRVTAGSSGGTAASVASSFGAAGLGTDTGNSIRGPSSHQSLVGIRSTMGLTSRSGVVPLSYAADIAGPMARTVADAVALFQVIVGPDPDDPVTAAAGTHMHPNYAASLLPDALRGKRIGVLQQAYARGSADPEIIAIFREAVASLERAGATVIDSVVISRYDSLSRALRGNCNRFRFDFEKWLASTGQTMPVSSLAQVVESGKFHASVRGRLNSALQATVAPEDNPGCATRAQLGREVATAIGETMDSLRLDAFVYPTWSNPPRGIADDSSATGDNSQVFSPLTGWPAIQVPMGYSRGNTLPAGMTFFSRAWSEPLLISLAYSYEQATRHRRAPALTPPIRR